MKTSTTLPGKVEPAKPNLKGFDSDTVITSSTAEEFVKEGYMFCARYLSLSATQSSSDLTTEEATDILNAGLSLIAVQHVESEGWEPNEQLGAEHGSNAASNAASIGLPKGMNIWCDLEGVAEGTSSADVVDYCQAWYSAVNGKGYVPGLYVGANCGLSGDDLYYDLSFEHYWKSLSDVPEVAVRGYQLIQGDTITVNGIGIDSDTTQDDNLGGKVLWLVAIGV